VKNVNRAWQRAVLVAHGFQPEYATKVIRDDATNEERTVHTALLTKDSQERLRSITSASTICEREARSRWLDAGVPLQRFEEQHARLQWFAAEGRKRRRTESVAPPEAAS
jgi:hypothetical protein